MVYLLIHNHPGLCTPFPHLHVTKYDILSHAINRNRREKKRKRNINIDLAVVVSQWFRVVTYNKIDQIHENSNKFSLSNTDKE